MIYSNKKTFHNTLYLRLLICSVLVLTVAAGCGKKKDVPKPEKEVKKVFSDAKVSLFPKREFIKDNLTHSLLTQDDASLERVETTDMWYAAHGSLEDVTAFYEKKYPHKITEKNIQNKSIFYQFSSVPNISKAIQEGVSPIILIDIRQRKLSEAEKAAYKKVINELKKQNDAVAKRRIQQLERIMGEHPMVKINVRKVAPEAKS